MTSALLRGLRAWRPRERAPGSALSAAALLLCVAVVAHPQPATTSTASSTASAASAASAASGARGEAGQDRSGGRPDDATGLARADRVVATTVLPPIPGALEFAAAVAAQAGRGATTLGEVYGPTAPGGDLGIPVPVLEAYRAAEATLARTDPGCGLAWWLLAGIGKVESGHAAGGRVDDSGRTRGNILGPLLDGSTPGTAVIGDSDGGRLDGDASFDRAVGPMQFLPGTWKGFGRDGSGDGVADPHNVRDAALGAGRYLCASGADLGTPEGRNRALLRYNNSSAYVAKVLGFAQQYAGGAVAVAPLSGSVPAPAPAPAPASTEPAPPPAPPPSPSSEAAAPPVSETAPVPTPTATTAPSPTPTPSETPTPTPTETPTPTPTPTPTETTPTPTPTPTEPEPPPPTP